MSVAYGRAWGVLPATGFPLLFASRYGPTKAEQFAGNTSRSTTSCYGYVSRALCPADRPISVKWYVPIHHLLSCSTLFKLIHKCRGRIFRFSIVWGLWILNRTGFTEACVSRVKPTAISLRLYCFPPWLWLLLHPSFTCSTVLNAVNSFSIILWVQLIYFSNIVAPGFIPTFRLRLPTQDMKPGFETRRHFGFALYTLPK